MTLAQLILKRNRSDQRPFYPRSIITGQEIDMICPFELSRVDSICQETNAFLEAEADSSARERLLIEIEGLIERCKKNKFEGARLQDIDVYEELNEKLDECIHRLEEKRLSLCTGSKFEARVEFNTEKYLSLLTCGWPRNQSYMNKIWVFCPVGCSFCGQAIARRKNQE